MLGGGTDTFPLLPPVGETPSLNYNSQRVLRERGASFCRKSVPALGAPTTATTGAIQSPWDLGCWGPDRGRHGNGGAPSPELAKGGSKPKQPKPGSALTSPPPCGGWSGPGAGSWDWGHQGLGWGNRALILPCGCPGISRLGDTGAGGPREGAVQVGDSGGCWGLDTGGATCAARGREKVLEARSRR